MDKKVSCLFKKREKKSLGHVGFLIYSQRLIIFYVDVLIKFCVSHYIQYICFIFKIHGKGKGHEYLHKKGDLTF